MNETDILLNGDATSPNSDDDPMIFGFRQTIALSWFLLVLAIFCEAGGTICMKLSDSFANVLPSVMIFVCYGISFTLMPIILRRIDLSIMYAIWSGIGTLATAVAGFCYFGEKVTTTKVSAILVIIVGVCMLKFQEGESEKVEKSTDRENLSL
mmetsp:Transcript_13054/g.26655  ORF Transcript_13054/g.26655 Transcript_13054/m.26655 type:complete len:153 (+) Transcript_13054:18-476(+)